MAKLTEQLDTINSGKRIVAPADPGPSFIGGLAKLASGAVSGLAANAQAERQNTLFEQNQSDRAAVNDTSRKVFQLQQKAAEFGRSDPGFDPALAPNVELDQFVPQAAIDAARQLSRTQRGVTQGRVAMEQMQLQLEKTVNDLHQQYPDSVAAINNYLHDAGFEHYLFRDQKAQDAMTAAQEKGTAEGLNAAVEVATKNGLALPGMTPEQIARAGMDLIHAQTLAEINNKTATAQREATAANQSNFKFNQEQNDRKTLAAINATGNAYLGSVLDVVSNLANAAGTDEQYKQLAATQSQINQGIDVYTSHQEQRMYAAGATQDMVKAMRETSEIKKKAVNDIFFGPASRFSQTHRSFQEMQDKLGLSTVDALPVYSMAVRLIGQGGVTQLFSGDPNMGLSPEFTKALTTELKAYDPTHPNRAINMLYQAGEIIKGNTALQDIPESRITPDLMRTMNATTVGSANHILDPEPDNDEEYQQFHNGLGALSIAALRIQPGTKDVRSLDWAIGAIANGKTTAVLTKMMKDPQYKDRATPLMQETRAAAAQILEVSRTAVDPVLGQKIEWKNGHYQVSVRASKGGGDSIMLPDGSSYQPIGGNMMASSPDPRLQHQADAMNASVNYLANTAQFDQSIPKGVTPLMLKEHYALGKALPKPKAEASAEEKWQASFNQLNDTLGQMNKEIQEKIPFKTSISFTSPRDAMIRTVIGEERNPEAQKAVAAVIANRAKRSGLTPEEVVLAKNQFEPWGNSKTAQRLMSISEDSPEYKKAAEAVDAVLRGEYSSNATHFYAPTAQAQLGREKPSWDNGSGQRIGDSLFFELDYKG